MFSHTTVAPFILMQTRQALQAHCRDVTFCEGARPPSAFDSLAKLMPRGAWASSTFRKCLEHPLSVFVLVRTQRDILRYWPKFFKRVYNLWSTDLTPCWQLTLLSDTIECLSEKSNEWNLKQRHGNTLVLSTIKSRHNTDTLNCKKQGKRCFMLSPILHKYWLNF